MKRNLFIVVNSWCVLGGQLKEGRASGGGGESDLSSSCWPALQSRLDSRTWGQVTVIVLKGGVFQNNGQLMECIDKMDRVEFNLALSLLLFMMGTSFLPEYWLVNAGSSSSSSRSIGLLLCWDVCLIYYTNPKYWYSVEIYWRGISII